MKTTIIIESKGGRYYATVQGQRGGGYQGQKAGLTPYDAAASAARAMVQYGQDNPDGAVLMAPPEVMELVPKHLREVAPCAS